jgi:hypothetical protein
MKLLGLEYDQGSLAFVKELLLLGNVFKALLLRILELRTVYRNTQVYTNKNIINKKQYTKQYKQSKTILQSYCICRKGHVSARIDENGVKTEKLWLNYDSRGLLVKDLNLEGL